MKRPAPPDADMNADPSRRPTKRIRRVKHTTKHTQPQAREIVAGAQDDEVFHAQLQQAVLLALSAAGFEAAQPAALQMFCSLADEYMCRFLSVARASMTSSRRTTPTPQDFVAALAAARLTPSHLAPFAAVPADAAAITQPALPPAPPPDDAPPSSLLLTVLGGALAAHGSGGDAAGARRREGGRGRGRGRGAGNFVPPHLPPFPSRHAWQATPVFATRAVVDKMALRERATEEGVLAERALRRLTETTRRNMMMAGDDGSGERGAVEEAPAAVVGEEGEEGDGLGAKAGRAWDAALNAALRLDEDAELAQVAGLDIGFDEDEPMGGVKPTAVAPFAALEDGASVNYEDRFWRDAASMFYM